MRVPSGNITNYLYFVAVDSKLVPQAEVVAVKEGLGRYTCISASAEKAREMIRDGAARAMKLI